MISNLKKNAVRGFAAMFVAMAALTTGMSAQAQALEMKNGTRSLVFDRNMNGSKYYRIPALATMPDGRVVAVADKRIDDNSDLPGRIDVVCRLSDDNGVTWGPMITVVEHDENGGYGDPALVYDKKTGDLVCIFTHGHGLWSAKDGDPARIMVSRSSDRGETWTKPMDITPSLFTSYQGNGPVKLITSFASSGRALQMRDGRVMFVLIGLPQKMAPWLQCYAVYSDDGGYTWSITSTPVDMEGDEAKVVEREDGTLIMSIRNRNKGNRKFAYSTDRGATWTQPELIETLIEPACNGDIIAIERNGKEYLLQSVPNDPKARKNVTVLSSEDGGKTWTPAVVVCPTGSAYSALTPLNNGNIGILTEEDCADTDGFQLWFTELMFINSSL